MVRRLVESKTRTYHGLVGTGRTARRWDGVGQDWTPTEQFAQETSDPRTFKASSKYCMNVSPEARTSEMLIVESKTRTYYGRVDTGRRTAGRRGRAETGSTGRRRDGSPRRKPYLLPPRRWKNDLLGVSLEARRKRTLWKPLGEQRPRSTTGSQPVRPRFITGTRSALRSWMLTSVPPPVCHCNLFSRKAYPGM